MLIGERVTLHPLRREDLPRLREFAHNVEVEVASGGDPPRPHALEAMEAQYDEQAKSDSSARAEFGIEVDGELIGHCGLAGFDLTARTCELGIIIGEPSRWGQGYGREAVRLLVDYAFRLRNMRRVYLTTIATNERAIRAYRACGFVEEGRAREHTWCNGRYVDLIHMGLLRREWTGGEVAPDD